uniref:Uncharacterized protein n=1 Tax=Arundo donax TaxID=35708 RepID=A0A0A9ARM0_ARUDO
MSPHTNCFVPELLQISTHLEHTSHMQNHTSNSEIYLFVFDS